MFSKERFETRFLRCVWKRAFSKRSGKQVEGGDIQVRQELELEIQTADVYLQRVRLRRRAERYEADLYFKEQDSVLDPNIYYTSL